MNIGFDAKRIFFNKGGIGNYGRNTIHYLSSNIKTNHYSLYTPTENHNKLFTAPTGCEVKHAPLFFQGVFSKHWRRNGLKGSIKKDGIKVYHGLSNVLPKRFDQTGVKSVVTVHDLIFLRFPQFYQEAEIKKYKAGFAESSKIADIVVAVSKQTKDDLIEFFKISPQKIKVLYQSCHPEYFKDRQDDELETVRKKYNLPKNFILNVGAIEKRKNLLSVLRTLKDKRIDVPLVVVGRQTEYGNQVKKYIEEQDMNDRVTILHSIEDRALSCIYKMAELTVYPSLYEGFGIPVIESLASGTPVITSRGTCLKEAGGPDSLYVNPGSTEEIANAMHSILFDRDERLRRSIAGKEYVQRFEGEHLAKELNAIYESLA